MPEIDNCPPLSRSDKISVATLQAAKDNFTLGPGNEDRTFEALEAMAFCAVIFIESAHDSLKAANFFHKAFKEHLNDPWTPSKQTKT